MRGKQWTGSIDSFEDLIDLLEMSLDENELIVNIVKAKQGEQRTELIDLRREIQLLQGNEESLGDLHVDLIEDHIELLHELNGEQIE